MPPKTLFLSAFFLFASALCLQAQETYEYAAVTYTSVNGYTIGVSTADNYVETKVKSKFDGKLSNGDLTPLLEKVNELVKEGWEVYSTSVVTTGSITYHLRRKKP